MKRLVLAFLFCGVFAISACAGCVTNKECFVCTDLDRFAAIDRVMSLSGATSAQSIKMAKQGFDDGVLIIVPAETKLDILEKINQHISWAEIKGTRVIIGNTFVKCD